MHPQVFMSAVREFVDSHGKDERFKDIVASLGGVTDALATLDPARASKSAGQREVDAAVAPPEGRTEPPKTRPAADNADGQPKTFAEANQAAKERIAA